MIGSHADRRPGTLNDLFFQAAGRCRDQLPPRAIQEQHRGGVSAENLLHPLQQRGKHIISIQVGQRRIGNRPDIPELSLRIRRQAQRRFHEERLTPPQTTQAAASPGEPNTIPRPGARPTFRRAADAHERAPVLYERLAAAGGSNEEQRRQEAAFHRAAAPPTGSEPTQPNHFSSAAP
jgi:hypothetical protein